jgi:hypothetical protein
VAADRQKPDTPPQDEAHSFPSGALNPVLREDSLQQAPNTAPLTCHAYEQLLSGETVSWNQILREHPLLGTITVTHLVNAGVVEVTPDYDPSTDTADFRLRTREPNPCDDPSTAHDE